MSSETIPEIRLQRLAESDRSHLFTDCETYLGHTVYADLIDCADSHDWSHLAESSDCVDPTIF